MGYSTTVKNIIFDKGKILTLRNEYYNFNKGKILTLTKYLSTIFPQI
jgi:hypothetical protein